MPADSYLALPVNALAWLGRQGPRAVTASVFIGIAVPPIGHVLRSFVTHTIFILLAISLMRLDMALFLRELRRPGITIAATVWTLVAVPLVFGLACTVTGLDKSSPELFLALMLQAVASPMMASPALAALIGLDPTLVLTTLLTSTLFVTLTAPAYAHLFFGEALKLSPQTLGLRLFVIVLGAAALAAVVRGVFGIRAIERQKEAVDGFNILILFVFVCALMGDVGSAVLANPVRTAELLVGAFTVFFSLFALTVLGFRWVGHERAIALGLMVSQRNMGLMLAATDGLLPGSTWLYFALSQFPIYLSPQMLKPIADRMRKLRSSRPER
jgi:BASS family bile acid:Na+ symporter